MKKSLRFAGMVTGLTISAFGFFHYGRVTAPQSAPIYLTVNVPRDLVGVAPLPNGEVQVKAWDGDGREIVIYSVSAEEPIASAFSWR